MSLICVCLFPLCFHYVYLVSHPLALAYLLDSANSEGCDSWNPRYVSTHGPRNHYQKINCTVLEFFGLDKASLNGGGFPGYNTTSISSRGGSLLPPDTKGSRDSSLGIFHVVFGTWWCVTKQKSTADLYIYVYTWHIHLPRVHNNAYIIFSPCQPCFNMRYISDHHFCLMNFMTSILICTSFHILNLHLWKNIIHPTIMGNKRFITDFFLGGGKAPSPFTVPR